MKKEKQIKTYQRRTKSGKMVTVKAHTAKYDAAEKAKEAAKKKGAGSELEERMKKKPTQMEIPFEEMDEKKVLEDVKKEETGAKETKSRKSDKVVYKHMYGPEGNGDPKRSAADNATSSIRESASARNALSSSDANTFEQFKRTKAYKDLSPAAKEWAHYYKDGGWLKNSSKEGKAKTKTSPKKAATPKSSDTGEISAADFKEWYHGTGSAADKKVAKALRAKLGRAGYKKLEDEAIDNYSSRGHLKMFKSLGSMSNDLTPAKSSKTTKETSSKTIGSKSKGINDRAMDDLVKKGYSRKVLSKLKEDGYNFRTQTWSDGSGKSPLDLIYERYGGTKRRASSSEGYNERSKRSSKGVVGNRALKQYETLSKTHNVYRYDDYTMVYKGNKGYKFSGIGTSKDPYVLEPASADELKRAKSDYKSSGRRF